MNLCKLTPFLFCLGAAWAIDVESSKPVPNTVNTNNGSNLKKFSIFSGDPDRIKRANEVDLKFVESKLEVSPNPFSFAPAGNLTARPEMAFSLSVKNLGKRPFTLSFPNSQRYNLIIKNAAGQKIYDWVSDKEFVDAIGTVMVNPSDRIAYREKMGEDDFGHALPAGSYTAEMSVANYPELKASAMFVIR
jgi:hypothetical protein